MNNTSLDLSQTEESSLTAQDIVFAVLYSAIVVPGVVGNGVIITIVRKTPSMHTATNYLLMNLAVADLLTLLLCPGLYDFALTKVRLQGLTGDLVCKLFAGNAVVPITINVAVVTVCTIAVERYLALVKPFRNIRLTKESKTSPLTIDFPIRTMMEGFTVPSVPTTTVRCVYLADLLTVYVIHWEQRRTADFSG
ncbi:hypothetical protein ACROYT_G003017 [Oculina patagonica]